MILYQYTDGYRYNSDTIFLYDFIIKYKIKGSVLDVGCGCGILGLLIKRDFNEIKLSQIDIQEKNKSLALKNAKANGIESQTVYGDFLKYDFDEKYDFIISNPPFYHSGSIKSENHSLFLSRHSKALEINSFVKKAYSLLNPKGSLIFCYDAKQLDSLFVCLTNAKFKVNEVRFVHVNEQKSASLVMIYAKRESKSLCKILPPLVLYEGKKYTKVVEDIFKKADTNSENV